MADSTRCTGAAFIDDVVHTVPEGTRTDFRACAFTLGTAAAISHSDLGQVSRILREQTRFQLSAEEAQEFYHVYWSGYHLTNGLPVGIRAADGTKVGEFNHHGGEGPELPVELRLAAPKEMPTTLEEQHRIMEDEGRLFRAFANDEGVIFVEDNIDRSSHFPEQPWKDKTMKGNISRTPRGGGQTH
jgi:hypothetical protein